MTSFRKYNSVKEFCDNLEASFIEYLKEKDVYKLRTFIITKVTESKFIVKLGLGEFIGKCEVTWVEKNGEYNAVDCMKKLVSFVDKLIAKNPSRIEDVDPNLLNVGIIATMNLPTGMIISAENAKNATKDVSFFTRLKDSFSLKNVKDAVPIIGRYPYDRLLSVIYAEIRRKCDIKSRSAVFLKTTETNDWVAVTDQLENLGYSVINSSKRLIIIW